MVDQATQSLEGAPAAPTPTGNAFADSKARQEHFTQLTKFFEQKGAQSPAPNAPQEFSPTGVRIQPGQSTPNADDLALIEASHQDLVKRFPDNNQAREVLERARMDVFAGRALDQDAISAAFGKAIETPESRATAAAVDELAKVTAVDGSVRGDQLPPKLLRGYSLPRDCVYDAEELVAGLKLAQEIGLDQTQLDAYFKIQMGDSNG